MYCFKYVRRFVCYVLVSVCNGNSVHSCMILIHSDRIHLSYQYLSHVSTKTCCLLLTASRWFAPESFTTKTIYLSFGHFSVIWYYKYRSPRHQSQYGLAGLASINVLVIMSLSTLKNVVILYKKLFLFIYVRLYFPVLCTIGVSYSK